MPSEEEMQKGLRNLKRNNNTVDYIITHCCSTSTQREIGVSPLYVPDKKTEFLEQIKTLVRYKKWFFGHYHDNININDKEILIYEQIVRIL